MASLGGWTVAGAVAVLALMVLIGSMWIFGWGFFQRATADFRGETAQIERVRADPNFRIAAYDMFFQQCVAVQNTEAQIRAQEAELATKPPEGRVVQINANLSALRASREAKINKYNADARRTDTVGRFRDSNLPYQLDASDERTTCEA